jgi:RNA polymerase primary sigma factor
MELRDWQVEGLAAWAAAGRGVIEAVTGTGKTRLALAAVRAVVDRGGCALVIVPTIDLQGQWVRALATVIARERIGRLGGGGSDDLHDRDVVVATPTSAATLPIDPPLGRLGLLVADEAHRYGAPTWGAALRETFPLRLALTATFERGDDGLVEVLEPYFGGVVLRYGFDRAVAEGTIAPFRIALVGVDLTPAERAAHDEADRGVRRAHAAIVAAGGVPREPRRMIAALAAIVAEAERGGAAGPLVRAAREYLARVRIRREIAAGASAKLAVLGEVGGALAGATTLVFTDTVEQAEGAARVLARAGRRAEVLHGGLSDERRRVRLAVLRSGGIDVLVAPRVLDEGVDVPDADVGIALSAFRTRRHLIQRLGRVLRVKADGREARLVLVHARGTLEDPAQGGHADFLAEVTGVARSIDPIDDAASLAAWLARPS